MFAKIQRIHFVGIGGIGMSGIAEVLLNLGYKVSGSDLKASAITRRLAAMGALTFEGHRAENLAGAEVVVTSSAIARDNPEVAAAHASHIPVIPRAEMLAELMRLKYGIAIAGMHGKTTTTSMVAVVLAAGGLDPTVVIGGRVDAMGSNARVGKSEYFVAEADESDRSFLKLSPILAVVTNIDREHMDCYRDMADVERTFIDFLDRVPFYGMVVACNDNDDLRSVLPAVRRRIVTYGTREGSDFLITDMRSAISGESHFASSAFRVQYHDRDLGEFQLHVPGVHNVRNATAAIAVGVGLDIPIDKIRASLAAYNGVDRRFQLKGRANGVTVIDDYGHHPTEIRATLGRRAPMWIPSHSCHLSAASLHPNAIAARRVRHGFRDADTVDGARYLRRERDPDPGCYWRATGSTNQQDRSTARYVCQFIRRSSRAGREVRTVRRPRAHSRRR